MNDQPPLEELLYEEEGTTLDFKREQYVFVSGNDYQKSELLKDILAFANAWRRSDAYILIGVEEVKGGRSTPLGIEIDFEGAQLQQFVNSKTQKPIDFNYRTLLIDGLKIGVIRIPLQSRPYYLEKDYGKLKRYVVYIRRGSSTDEASPEEIHNMGKAEVQDTQESPKIEFAFANLKERTSLGASMPIEAIVLDMRLTIGRDLAVVSNYEVGQNAALERNPRIVEIRATNLFRKEDGKWKMIGHHTDLLPFIQE